MKQELNSKKLILIYCICIFVLSWGVQITAILTTQGLNDPKMNWWLATVMLTPTIVTIFFLKYNPSLRAKFLWKPSWKLLYATFVAVLVPIVMGLIVVFTFEHFDWGNSQWFEFLGDKIVISGGPFLFGLGTQTWIVFFLNLFITGLAFALLNGIIASGEEIAWRGLLQGLLIERLGKWKGILLLGFLWSMFHLPIQLFGYNYPESPVVGSLIISPLILIGYSFFMGWITIYSKSFIPAAIAHGAGNGIQEGIISQIELSTPELNLYLIRLITSLTFGLIFIYFLNRNKSKSVHQKQL
jgi:uncharacterized protein